MAIDDANGSGTKSLAARIRECIAEAEALHHHVVAAYLGTALHVLPGAVLAEQKGDGRSTPLH